MQLVDECFVGSCALTKQSCSQQVITVQSGCPIHQSWHGWNLKPQGTPRHPKIKVNYTRKCPPQV